MVNKRGFIKIVEATISIVIIIGVMLVLVGQQTPRQEIELFDEIHPILDEMARNSTTREAVLSYELNEDPDNGNNGPIIEMLERFVEERIDLLFIEQKVIICEIDSLCPIDQWPVVRGEVYSGERIITTSLERDFEPRKVKIFLWREPQ